MQDVLQSSWEQVLKVSKENDNILMTFTMNLEIHSNTNIQRALCR